MAEGLSAAEVGKESNEHHHHTGHVGATRDRAITIIEAVLLAIVAFVAAYSGFASAKWSTDHVSILRTHRRLVRKRAPRT